MKITTKSLFHVGPAFLFGLLAVVGLAGPALSLPLAASLALLVVSALGLRVGVVLTAAEAPEEPSRPAAPHAGVHTPALRRAS